MRHFRRSFGVRSWHSRGGGACIILLLVAIARAVSAQAMGPVGHFYNSLRGMHVAGYQGWFTCPGDGAGLGWGHWRRGSGAAWDPKQVAVDMWPDTTELGPDERCPTGFHLPSGAPAYLFSDQNAKTVARHFSWMRRYGIDGAAMQRFVAAISRDATRRAFDRVLENARIGAEANRRGFFVMYDVSGMNGAGALREIERDWRHLAGDLRITDSPAYVYDRGKPVVGVWGLGFRDRNVSPEDAAAIIRYLKTGPVPATALGGVPASWRNLNADGRWPDSRTEAGWRSLYRSLDVISPWSVGRFRDDRGADDFARQRIAPDLAEARRLGIEYMPVVFPGVSRHNIPVPKTKLIVPINTIPRRCGEFYRRQVDNAIKAGAEMLYTAMFDEANEGTAIFKVAAAPAQEPVGAALLPLDAGECRNATSDMYLRLAGDATRLLPQPR